ncbi:MAG: glycerol-3-phosphate 1-O-acyltransferase PlsY [Alphaproteobacteria bacterium]
MPDSLSAIALSPSTYLAALGGYLLGSIPFGLTLTWLAGGGDIRRIGSGNIGATNVLRTGRKDLAALTLLLDGAKGAAAVLIASRWGPDFEVLAAAGAILGHIAPVWLRFRGGKGVATALGIALALSWKAGLVMVLIWIIVAAVTRYSSVAGMAAIVAGPGLFGAFGTHMQNEFAIAMCVIVLFKHMPNVRRLLERKEPKIGEGGANVAES